MFHVDLDAFYASVEQNDFPEYKGKPVIVGALPGHRGVVSACSYEARKYGIHSAMPISLAVACCPHGIFLPVRMGRYLEVSEKIMHVFNNYSPEVRQLSVDEAFLDMTGTERLFGHPVESAKRLKQQIRDAFGLTISVGIAPNYFLAKLASAYSKPDGLYFLEEGKEIEFLDSLELKDIWGLGKKTLARLLELNIRTVPALRSYSEKLLQSMLGKAAGTYLFNAVRGVDPGMFTSEAKSRSLSNELTYEEDTANADTVKKTLLSLCHQVMFRMLKECSRAKTVSVKVRFSDFSTVSVQKTVPHWIASAEELFAIVRGLLSAKWDGKRPIRLLGVGVNPVRADACTEQLALFEDAFDKKRKVEEAVLEVNSRHSPKSIVKASNLGDVRKGGKE